MARQVGPVKIIGTIDECTYYKMMGKYYVRLKSSLTARRFWRDKAFAGSRRSCERMGQASAFASWLYSYYPREKKSRALWREIVGGVIKMIKAGWEREVIEAWFFLEYLGGKLELQEKRDKTAPQRKRPLRRKVLTYCKTRLLKFIYDELPQREGALATEIKEAYEGTPRRRVAEESLWRPAPANKRVATLLQGEFAESHQRLLRA